MLNYESYIFPNLFNRYDKVNDINKDVNGKGTLERFNEIMGKDVDDNIVPLVENLLSNIYVTETMQDKFIPSLEQMLGVNVFLFNTAASRKKVLKVIMDIYNLKGLELVYHRLFAMGGYPSITVTNVIQAFGFDSTTTFDSPERTFDSGCPKCSKVTFEVPKATPFTDEEKLMFSNIINFNTPINVQLKSFIRDDSGTPHEHEIELPSKANGYKYKILNEI